MQISISYSSTDEVPIDLPPMPPEVKSWRTSHPKGQQLLWKTFRTAATSLSVYLEGETGTGKELLARLLHAWSPRSSGPFVPLHCGALPENLAESELFGHIKGSFTGALQNRVGACLQAHGGTLFLDEIADLSLELQVKLLRFLEAGEIRPVGSDQIRHASVRIICATHKSLPQLVKSGKFREDLYYRIASITLQIPNLRDRKSDIELLVQEHLEQLQTSISRDALADLTCRTWPGNVRQLKHALDRAYALSANKKQLEKMDFDEEPTVVLPTEVNTTPIISMPLNLEHLEKIAILNALQAHEGNRKKSAQALGIARSTLFERMKRHGIQGPEIKAKWAITTAQFF